MTVEADRYLKQHGFDSILKPLMRAYPEKAPMAAWIRVQRFVEPHRGVMALEGKHARDRKRGEDWAEECSYRLHGEVFNGFHGSLLSMLAMLPPMLASLEYIKQGLEAAIDESP